MTWKEFKDEVDKQLSEANLSQECSIDWIDTHPNANRNSVTLTPVYNSDCISFYIEDKS